MKKSRNIPLLQVSMHTRTRQNDWQGGALGIHLSHGLSFRLAREQRKIHLVASDYRYRMTFKRNIPRYEWGGLVLNNMKGWLLARFLRLSEEGAKRPRELHLCMATVWNCLENSFSVQTIPYSVKKDTTVARSAGSAPRSISGIWKRWAKNRWLIETL